MPPPSQPVPGAPPPGGDLSLNLRPSSRTTSAPSSPAKTRESLFQRVQSLTGAARDQESTNPKYEDKTMLQDGSAESTQSSSEKIIPTQSFLYVNANEQNTRVIEIPHKIECDESGLQTFQISNNEELLPVRMTEGSVYYSPAFRLDESNVCAEAVEAILFDSLEGELILAEYQQNNFLSSTTQQKLTDVLLSRSAKSMTVAKHVQNYFVKLTDAIVKLMPNEDPSVYYIPPQSSGNESKNPKGKLPDKWRNLTYQLRIRGILQKKKSKEKQANSVDTQKIQNVKDEVDIHIKSLQILREPISQVLEHWDATYNYRKLIRSSSNSLDDILVEWPILKTDIGPQLIECEFDKLHRYEGLSNKWISFFNTLYEIKKTSIRDSVGKEYCSTYENLTTAQPEILAGIQIQLLPYLIPPITKIKTGSGVIVKPTIWESSEGFVTYCKGASILGAAVSGATRGQGFGGKDRCFTLLVIDDQNTDWSKYFRGRRLHGDYEIRVEQAEFRELSLIASEAGTTVSMAVFRNGTKVIRSFKPDFVLVRQNLRDANEDNKNLLLGLMYGGIPSVNNLQAIYNFQDKPWVFAHLLGLQRRWGREGFPLIEQTYYPNYREMMSAPRYPVVIKLGHAHGGIGKARAENSQEFLDLASLAALTNSYCTAEPYIDTKYDVHVQKIGNNYKAFMRKSISGNWKSNTGSAMLEQLAVTERHRSWVDHVAQLFGGLDICAIELLVGKDGKEYIIEVNDSALSLMGDSQEEDRRHIADLVTAKMQAYCRPPAVLTKTNSRGSVSGSSQVTSPSEDRPPGSAVGSAPTATGSHSSISSMTSGIGSMNSTSALGSSDVTTASSTALPPDHHQQLQRRDSQASQSSSVSSAPSVGRRQDEPPPVPPTSRMPFQRQGSQSQATGEDTEDTMKNLRKTFAGIFGDM